MLTQNEQACQRIDQFGRRHKAECKAVKSPIDEHRVPPIGRTWIPVVLFVQQVGCRDGLGYEFDRLGPFHLHLDAQCK